MLKLFRLILLFELLALPRLGLAQFNEQYTAGTYTLVGDSTQHLPGQLRLKNQWKLLVITPSGKKLRLGPEQVSSFQIGMHKYTILHDLIVTQGSNLRNVQAAFAEQLSNGRITLWRYTHLWNNGSNWLFLYRYPLSFYLAAGIGPHLLAVHDRGNPEDFRQQVRPLLQQRPDLIQLLDEGRLTYANLPAAIRAVNSNAPLTQLSAPFLK